VLHLWGESVQHLWLAAPRTDMARSARMFLCARCRAQVLLCSHCDRGQLFCSRACSLASRCERRRQAARRYQDSRAGRLKHAARTACWRARRRALGQVFAAVDIDKVTHQGCPRRSADASLRACNSIFNTASACEPTSPTDSAADAATTDAVAVSFAALTCRRCAQVLGPHVRRGWLSRIRRGGRGPRGSPHDHPS